MASTRGVMAELRSKVASGDRRTTGALAVALLVALAPLDIGQLLFAVVGAVAYALLQPLAVPAAHRQKSASASSAGKLGSHGDSSPRAGGASQSRRATNARASPVGGSARATPPQSSQLVAKPSVQPLAPLALKAANWDSQVDELVTSLLPTAASERAAERLGARIQRGVQKLVPGAEVCCFASSATLRGGAFGVAVPDVDVVVSCAPATLVGRLLGGKAPGTPLGGSQRKQMQKAVLRAFTDHLVRSGDFRFRRSAFSADEPKVTLLAAAGAQADAIPLDLAVNSPTPLHNAALLTECGRIDARARALVLLVRRWARHRGICHAARGHLSPYCWTLMAIYFLQVGEEDGAQVLPPLRGFKVASSLAGEVADAEGDKQASDSAEATSAHAASKSVGALFRDFLSFYGGRFDAGSEAVSVRLGCRTAPSPRMPLHVVFGENGEKGVVAPSIEDPFDPKRNLAASMNAVGVARLQEELGRASSLLAGGAPLTEMLELWSPPEEGGDADATTTVA